VALLFESLADERYAKDPKAKTESTMNPIGFGELDFFGGIRRGKRAVAIANTITTTTQQPNTQKDEHR